MSAVIALKPTTIAIKDAVRSLFPKSKLEQKTKLDMPVPIFHQNETTNCEENGFPTKGFRTIKM